MQVQDIHRLADVKGLPPEELEALAPVAERYAFLANDYYLDLIDWDDPVDPIRRLIIPDPGELDAWGELDPSNEQANTPTRGLQHKYRDTVLLLTTQACGGYCRFCFRKRLFIRGNTEVAVDLDPAVDYIRSHPEVTNVLLSGGDPLALGTPAILNMVERIRAIPHVRIVRLGSRMPAFNPYRILDDTALVEGLSSHSRPGARIFVITQFTHPRELTEPAVEALDRLQRAGIICVNQNPLLRGVNDDPDTLARLLARASWAGATPYYVFQCRPTVGNRPFTVPLTEAFTVFNEARTRVSGLARRARYTMSHATGKVVVVGMDDERVYARYHRAKDPENDGRLLVLERDDEAYWWDG